MLFKHSILLATIAATTALLGCDSATSSGMASSEEEVASASERCLPDDSTLATVLGLSPEQQTKLANLHAHHRSDGGTHHHHHPDGGFHDHPDGGGHHWGRPSTDQIVSWLTTALDLTPDQVTKLRDYLAKQASSTPAPASS